MSTVTTHITLAWQRMESAHLSIPKRMFMAFPVKTRMYHSGKREKYGLHI